MYHTMVSWHLIGIHLLSNGRLFLTNIFLFACLWYNFMVLLNGFSLSLPATIKIVSNWFMGFKVHAKKVENIIMDSLSFTTDRFIGTVFLFVCRWNEGEPNQSNWTEKICHSIEADFVVEMKYSGTTWQKNNQKKTGKNRMLIQMGPTKKASCLILWPCLSNILFSLSRIRTELRSVDQNELEASRSEMREK